MILVTGGAGYIGSHVNLALSEAGHDTIILDDLSMGHAELVVAGRLVQGDFGDRALLDRLFSEHRIECVVHLAAFTDVDDSIARPADYYQNNVLKTITLLTAMKEHGVGKFIFSSTSAVYADDAAVPYTEKSQTDPICPYGRTKLFIERVLADFRVAYGLNYAIFRYFNAAGADPQGRVGEWHEPEPHLIPVILEVARGQRESISLFGTDYPTPDGTCVRDFIHVMDIAGAHVAALNHLNAGGDSDIYNLGYGTGYSVAEVIEACKTITNREIKVVPSGRRAGDGAISIADCSHAMDKIGWKPQHNDLGKIIESAWQWDLALHARA
jgi:UDP-glucose 4-epimerase